MKVPFEIGNHEALDVVDSGVEVTVIKDSFSAHFTLIRRQCKASSVRSSGPNYSWR